MKKISISALRSVSRLRAAVTATVLASVIVALPCVAEEPNPASFAAYVPAASAAELAAGKPLIRVHRGAAATLEATPGHEAARRVAAETAAESPRLVVEALFLWKKPRALSPAAERAALFDTMLAVRSLEGIEYFSASRGRREVLFKESFRVAGPGDLAPQPDLARMGGVEKATYYAWQKDASFGGVVYKIAAEAAGDAVRASFTNETPIRYSIIPLAGPGGLVMRFALVDTAEGVLFYLVLAAKAEIPGFLAKRVEDSFTNRSSAMFAWFVTRAEAAWAAAR